MIDTSRTLTIKEVTEFRAMTQTVVEPKAAPFVELDSNQLGSILGSNFDGRTYSGVELAEHFEISETAVRKIFNLIKQAVSEDQLKTKNRYTELAKALVSDCRQRPESQSMAEWGHELIQAASAFKPQSVEPQGWELAIRENKQAGKLAKKEALSELVDLRDWLTTDQEFGDKAFDAELQMIADIEYGREVKREAVRMKARKQARADIREAV